MSTAESKSAQRDVLRTIKCYGAKVLISNGNEEDLERDEYGSIIDYSSLYLELSAFPVEFSPSQKTLEKVGIRENVDVIFYLSKLELDQNEISYSDNDIDTIRQIISFQGVEYKIKSKNPYSLFGDDFLYVVIGAVKN